MVWPFRTSKEPIKSTSFATVQLNQSTFFITEDDAYDEHPFIYAKVHPKVPLLILTDNGCDAPRQRSADVTHLRQYLEDVPLSCNGDRPLNPGGERRYLVICSHCHYDHIGGLEQFSDDPTEVAQTPPSHGTPANGACEESENIKGEAVSPDPSKLVPNAAREEARSLAEIEAEVSHFREAILPPRRTYPITSSLIAASSHDQHFLNRSNGNLARHSLCKALGIKLPNYKITIWARDREQFQYHPPTADAPATLDSSGDFHAWDSVNLGIRFLHTPGHTPDSLSWYDSVEMTLYTGDLFYERGEFDQAIMFPGEGNWSDYVRSLAKLLRFVRQKNARVRMMSKHVGKLQAMKLRRQQMQGAVEVDPRPDEETDGEEDMDWEATDAVRRIKICCGHATAGADAEELILAVCGLWHTIRAGKIPVIRSKMIRGEMYDTWMPDEKEGRARFAVTSPRRLYEDWMRREQSGLP